MLYNVFLVFYVFYNELKFQHDQLPKDSCQKA